MKPLKSIGSKPKESQKTGLIAYSSHIGLVFIVVTFITLAILLPLIFIDNDSDNSANSSQLSTENIEANPVYSSATPVSSETVGVIIKPHYVPLEHPFMNGLKIFYDNQVEGCPHGSGISVLFSYEECYTFCDTIENCIGFNFNTISKFCVFYSNLECLNHIGTSPFTEVLGYLKNA